MPADAGEPAVPEAGETAAAVPLPDRDGAGTGAGDKESKGNKGSTMDKKNKKNKKPKTDKTDKKNRKPGAAKKAGRDRKPHPGRERRETPDTPQPAVEPDAGMDAAAAAADGYGTPGNLRDMGIEERLSALEKDHEALRTLTLALTGVVANLVGDSVAAVDAATCDPVAATCRHTVPGGDTGGYGNAGDDRDAGIQGIGDPIPAIGYPDTFWDPIGEKLDPAEIYGKPCIIEKAGGDGCGGSRADGDWNCGDLHDTPDDGSDDDCPADGAEQAVVTPETESGYGHPAAAEPEDDD